MKTASGPSVRPVVRHRGTTTGYQPIYGNISSNPKPGANLRPYARKNRLQIPRLYIQLINQLSIESGATPNRCTCSVHTIFFFAGPRFLTLYSIGNPIKHRVGGYTY